MKRSDYAPGGRPFTGRKFLITILAFFGVILAANLTMAWFAVRDFRGVVVDSGYVASQHFNADEAALAEMRARGWALSVEAPGGRPLLSVADAAGDPVSGLAVTATALRPLDQHDDQSLTMVETAPGLYAAQEALKPGRWKLALAAEGAGPRYAATLDFFVETP